MIDIRLTGGGRLQQQLRSIGQARETALREVLVSVADDIVRTARESVLANRKAPPSVPSPLAASIDKRVQTNEVSVGTNVDYAPFVELGTHRQAASPFLQPAFDDAVARLCLTRPGTGGAS